jgi:hypothetical protein
MVLSQSKGNTKMANKNTMRARRAGYAGYGAKTGIKVDSSVRKSNDAPRYGEKKFSDRRDS